MRIGIYSVASPLVGQNLTIAQDAKDLTLSVNYVGRTGTYDNTMKEKCMADLRNALNGVVNINFATADGNSQNIINGKNLVDIAEAYASFDGREIVFTNYHTVPVTGANDWRCDFKIPLSFDGTLPLNSGAKVTFDFDKFTNADVIGISGTKCAAVIKVDTTVGGRYSGIIQKLVTLSSAPGTSTGIDISASPILIIPTDVTHLELNSNDGMRMEIKDEILDSYIKTELLPHIMLDGLVEYCDKFFALDVRNWPSGTVTLSTSKELYAIQNLRVI